MNIWKINIFEWLKDCNDQWFAAKICLIIKLFRTVCLHAFCCSSPYKQDLNQTPSISVKGSKISSTCSLHSELLKFWYSLLSLKHLECRESLLQVFWANLFKTCSSFVLLDNCLPRICKIFQFVANACHNGKWAQVAVREILTRY